MTSKGEASCVELEVWGRDLCSRRVRGKPGEHSRWTGEQEEELALAGAGQSLMWISVPVKTRL